MKKIWRKRLGLLACLAMLLMGMTACSPSGKTESEAEETSAAIQTEEKQETASESKPEVSEKKEDKPKVTEDKEDKPEVTEKEKESEATAIVAPSVSGALHVEGTQLVDSRGNKVQLRGISTHGIAWFPQYVNQELFHELHKDWNANVMRLAMYTAENDGYCTDGDKNKLKQIVKDGVEYATNADMYVIIDWHVLRDENPNRNKEEAAKFFAEMSAEYKDADNVIYEICNEPNGSTSWSDVKKYALEIIPIIRENDKDALILVGTPTWCQDVDKAAEDPITEYDNVMYTLHFYATSHTDWLRERMNKAVDSGLPIFVSEFGTCDASGNGTFDEYQSDEWIKALDAKGISYVTWNLSNKNETSSIFADGCTKTSGFTQDDLSRNGKWTYALLTGGRKAESSLADDKQAQEKEEEKTDDADTKQEQASESVSGTDGDFKYAATVTGSWESEGKTFYQYSLELENVSGKDIDGWEITLSFAGNISFSDGWNGNYSVNGKELKITSMDYNGKVAAGAKISDIGFIISGNGNL